MLVNRNPKRRANLVRFIGVNIGTNCELLDRKVQFGSEPYLITIGSNVKITTGVKFITHDGGVYIFRRLDQYRNIDLFGRISVGSNVFIGNDVTILPNVTIGNNCVIGAGSIVTRSIPDNSIAAGVPARVLSTYDEYLTKNLKNFVNTKNLSNKQKKEFLKNRYQL